MDRLRRIRRTKLQAIEALGRANHHSSTQRVNDWESLRLSLNNNTRKHQFLALEAELHINKLGTNHPRPSSKEWRSRALRNTTSDSSKALGNRANIR